MSSPTSSSVKLFFSHHRTSGGKFLFPGVLRFNCLIAKLRDIKRLSNSFIHAGSFIQNARAGEVGAGSAGALCGLKTPMQRRAVGCTKKTPGLRNKTPPSRLCQ